jgi:dynein heavy chain 1
VINEDRMNNQLDLASIIEIDVRPKNPLLLVSAPGYDASSQVDQLAINLTKKMTSVAIGSPEAFKEAEQAIMSAARTGNWVLLKNVHLAPAWLVEMEKMIYKLEPKSTFRLFLTMEVNPKVPSTLIRSAYVIQFEPPQGMKAAMLRSYSEAITKERSDVKPV